MGITPTITFTTTVEINLHGRLGGRESAKTVWNTDATGLRHEHDTSSQSSHFSANEGHQREYEAKAAWIGSQRGAPLHPMATAPNFGSPAYAEASKITLNEEGREILNVLYEGSLSISGETWTTGRGDDDDHTVSELTVGDGNKGRVTVDLQLGEVEEHLVIDTPEGALDIHVDVYGEHHAETTFRANEGAFTLSDDDPEAADALGLAYEPDSKLVQHGGFGWGYLIRARDDAFYSNKVTGEAIGYSNEVIATDSEVGSFLHVPPLEDYLLYGHRFGCDQQVRFYGTTDISVDTLAATRSVYGHVDGDRVGGGAGQGPGDAGPLDARAMPAAAPPAGTDWDHLRRVLTSARRIDDFTRMLGLQPLAQFSGPLRDLSDLTSGGLERLGQWLEIETQVFGITVASDFQAGLTRQTGGFIAGLLDPMSGQLDAIEHAITVAEASPAVPIRPEHDATDASRCPTSESRRSEAQRRTSRA